MARSQSGDSIIDRVVRILEAFEADSPVRTVGEISQRAGLPMSTTSRLVEQLIAAGFLRRDGDRRVRVGIRLWELASRASAPTALRQVAMPFMEDLQAIVGHHTQLGVLEGHEVLILERLSSRQAVINFSRIAGRLPLYASSSGLVLLAHAPRELQESVLSGTLRAYTALSIREPERLRVELAEIRRRGVAFCPGYIDLAATGIAVPLHDARGKVIAALSVIVPNDNDAQTYVGALRTAARGLDRALKGPGR